MDKYVVSRELAEKLEDGGYPQSSVYQWLKDAEGTYILQRQKPPGYTGFGHVCAAPMADELVEQLPQWVKLFRNEKHVYWAGVVSEGFYNDKNWPDSAHKWCSARKPADALAELWLWCKQEGHL